MLIAGFRTRIASAALLPVLLGATWVHWKNGWLFTNTGGGWEYPLFLAVAVAVQFLLGDGAWAVGRARPAVGSPGLVLQRSEF